MADRIPLCNCLPSCPGLPVSEGGWFEFATSGFQRVHVDAHDDPQRVLIGELSARKWGRFTARIGERYLYDTADINSEVMSGGTVTIAQWGNTPSGAWACGPRAK